MSINIKDDLILVKDEDKTNQVEFCKYVNNQWKLKYLNTDKVYTYNRKNIEWHKDPKEIDIDQCMVYRNEIPLSNMKHILHFGSYIRVIFQNGSMKTYSGKEITIEKSSLTNQKAGNCFEYLHTLANEVSDKKDEEDTFLKRQYKKLTLISPRSVLASYLEGKPLKSSQSQSQVIFPFGFNQSQKSATEKAMIEQLSVIEGPPGTGKTQTILNIIANAIMNEKSVAVVSNNNSATANVLEKLQKYGLDFLAAYLGNKENKEAFFSNQSGTYPDMESWLMDESNIQSLKDRLTNAQYQLNKMLELKNRQAQLKQERSDLCTEYHYFQSYYEKSNLEEPHTEAFNKLKSDKVLRFFIEFEQNIKKGPIKLTTKLYNIFVYGISPFTFYKHPPEVILSFLQNTYYKKKIQELDEEIREISDRLQHYHFDEAMEVYTSDSMTLFKAILAKRYGNQISRAKFNQEVLWKNTNRFIKEYPLVLSTTHALRTNAQKQYMFDYVLVDEASQVDLVTGALALSSAKNAVVVGDVKQLPNVVTQDVKVRAERIFSSFDLHDAYDYTKHSLLSSIVQLYQNVPKTLLKEHYRCHPQIIGFCNQKFYNNELVVLTDHEDEDSPLVLYKTAEGNHARGTYNQRQIDVIMNEVIPNQKSQNSLGIVSPYRKQVEKMEYSKQEEKIEVDTVHKYQGREKDMMILSTVSNKVKKDDFVDDPNLINVAVSRAVEKLVVVVANNSENWNGTNIGDLVKYIQYNNFEVVESQVYSVFDLLYRDYSEKLLEIQKNSKKVSEFKSENLMNTIIESVLGLDDFSSYGYVMHQPLRMLIKDPIHLNEKERKYAMNYLTHTDFVIFNKMDKMPVLVVEVDGHAYHENNPKQLKRDEMKDEILRKYGIPILRLKTTGSNESEVLHNKLLELLEG